MCSLPFYLLRLVHLCSVLFHVVGTLCTYHAISSILSLVSSLLRMLLFPAEANYTCSSCIFCSVSSASSTCLFEVNCEKKMRRTTPFFFQAEDGIRGGRVTGVQTCALPI